MGRDVIFRQLCLAIDQLFDDSISFIGVSTAGDVNPVKGEITFATDNLLGWTGFPLKQMLEEKYGCMVEVENDAICALIGELDEGDGGNVTMLTFGTGVGGASMIDGKLSRSQSTAWGHVELYPDGPLCPGCNRHYGCAEMYVSGRALSKKIEEELHHSMDLSTFFHCYRQAEAWTIPILREYCMHLNNLLKMIVTSVSPTKIILGGGIMQSSDLMLPYLDSNLMNIIRLASHGNDAGMLGASKLPIQSFDPF